MKNKRLILTFLIALAFRNNNAQSNYELIGVTNQVSIDSLIGNLNQLTGNQSIFLDERAEVIGSRYKKSTGNITAANFLFNKLASYGLKVSRQNFGDDGQNIIAIQPGQSKSNQKVIICAHYDDLPNGDTAPGADDNGSGTVTVLEAARVLSKAQNSYTIIYALWDCEEQGLLGSSYFAKEARTNNDSIIAVINVDMIGWDNDNDGIGEIHTQDIMNSVPLSQEMLKLNKDLSIDLKVKITFPGSSSSDHSSFWRYKYSAIMLIESFSDFNKNYHQINDKVQFINQSYLERMAKLSIGMAAKKSECYTTADIEKTIPAAFNLYQNFPNPFNPITTIRYSLFKDSWVKLEIYDPIGNHVTTLVDKYQIAGSYELKVDGNTFSMLSSGVYFYILKNDNEHYVRKMLYLK